MEFHELYEAVRRWQLVIAAIAKILEPAPDQRSETVRQQMKLLLSWMQAHYNEPGDEVLVRNISAYTRGFWNGLFACYDTPHVPRTKNDHERFFRQTKTKHRRTTGRRSWNDYILRSGEFVVFVEDIEDRICKLIQFNSTPMKSSKPHPKQREEDVTYFLKNRVLTLGSITLSFVRFARLLLLGELPVEWINSLISYLNRAIKCIK